MERSLSSRTTKLQNTLKIGTFHNSKKISQGEPLEKSFFLQFLKSLFHFGISYGPFKMQCKDIRMHKKEMEIGPLRTEREQPF